MTSNDAPMRRAVITHTVSLDTVRAYLPSNYTAEKNMFDSVIIEGHDNAGWTLDGYVIPRLASGMIYAREIGDSE